MFKLKLPSEATIVEVGPRDGFQSIEKWIPTELKLKIISSLIDANFKKIEVTSFISPKAIPQMKDAKEIVTNLISENKDVEFYALVPNLRGALNAWDSGIKRITYVISASEMHNKENVRRTIEESFSDLSLIKKELPEMKIKLDIATSFGCPFQGDIPENQVMKMIEKSMKMAINEICLCDTIGVAHPVQTYSLLKNVKEKFPLLDFSLHFHDTQGMALSNILVALNLGYTTFETAVAGLGGCPFAPGAAGNLASEDLLNMMEKIYIHTGVDSDKLLETSSLIKYSINSNLTSHMANICQK
jgi:hydroxymethylglutaryl-CoA lyase